MRPGPSLFQPVRLPNRTDHHQNFKGRSPGLTDSLVWFGCGLSMGRQIGAGARLASRGRPIVAGIAGVKCAGICHITSMDETNLEIIVALGSWQTPGKAARWSWQVRQKVPPKFLVKGVTLGAKQRAQDSAQAAKAKILARV